MRARIKIHASAAAVVLGVTGAVVILTGPAQAHGTAFNPGSRTWLCYVNGLRQSGEMVPTNPACADVAAVDRNVMYSWYSTFHPASDGRREGFVSDAGICTGDRAGFEPYAAYRDDWPKTALTAGADVEFRYGNWVAHPGHFELYVTRDDWRADGQLTWSDLEDEPFSVSYFPDAPRLATTLPSQAVLGRVEDVPSGSADPNVLRGEDLFNVYYAWDGAWPADKDGYHIVFASWIRSDSPEDFFSCSDVVFDGGSGEIDMTGTLGSGGPTPSPSPSGTPSPSPSQTCSADYTITSSWSTGFHAEVTVTNTGNAAIPYWMVVLHLGEQADVADHWSSTLHSESGSQAMFHAAAWNGALAPDGTATFGFIGSGSAPQTTTAACTVETHS
ncbi:MAG: lytic polysaccharide monooxygenase [Kineosporiaceae bacterium]